VFTCGGLPTTWNTPSVKAVPYVFPSLALISGGRARLGTGKRFSRNAGLTSHQDDREKQCQSHNDFSFD